MISVLQKSPTRNFTAFFTLKRLILVSINRLRSDYELSMNFMELFSSDKSTLRYHNSRDSKKFPLLFMRESCSGQKMPDS